MTTNQTARPADLGFSVDRLARIDRWMDQQVASGKLAGLSVAIQRRGQPVFFKATGLRDEERRLPFEADTVVRIYSMTKPVTSVAAMMLFEEGRFLLDDPLSKYLPEFANQRVMGAGGFGFGGAVPAERDISVHDLFVHTSGLTYGFMMATQVDALYREKGIDFQTSEDTLAELVTKAAKLPLLAQPGKAWNYSISTDVLGRLVEVISGQPFDVFVRERILKPLKMHDTDFHVHAGKASRFASCYVKPPEKARVLFDDAQKSRFLQPGKLPSGGGGLVSTASDYMRFAQMLLNKGELDGARILGRKTVEYMTRNHLPGDLASMGTPRFAETNYNGIGFGLGFSIVLDPARAEVMGSAGEYAWGGLASTAFWCDPEEDLAVVFLTQLIPSSAYPLRRELRSLVYQALVD